ncbi:uncharacterized protein [Musca autumnalis]|uniref:uncharacterized protein n=1 Tax=Musca autumnalis TaxID=221902 RepID=UPI003CF89CD2
MRYFEQNCPLDGDSIPPQFGCIWSEIIQNYCRLCDRYNRVITKRKQIWKLAQPKHTKLKYRQKIKCPPVTTCKIEIVNKCDRTESTRTEQLAYPQLRQLNQLKSHPSFSVFNDTRKSGVNRLIRKSYLSVYSRLQNIVPEEESSQKKSWNTTENKSKLMQRMKALATPKQQIAAEEDRSRSRQRSDGPKMRRIRKLSKPRLRKEMQSYEWVFTKGLKNFKPTERLLKMSQPKKYELIHEKEDALHIPTNALNYKASRRIKALAEPAKSKQKTEVHFENPFKTNVKALKAVASKRVEELAKPKDYVDSNNRSDAYRVSRKALQAKTTPRLKELAEPRKRT